MNKSLTVKFILLLALLHHIGFSDSIHSIKSVLSNAVQFLSTCNRVKMPQTMKKTFGEKDFALSIWMKNICLQKIYSLC